MYILSLLIYIPPIRTPFCRINTLNERLFSFFVCCSYDLTIAVQSFYLFSKKLLTELEKKIQTKGEIAQLAVFFLLELVLYLKSFYRMTFLQI